MVEADNDYPSLLRYKGIEAHARHHFRYSKLKQASLLQIRYDDGDYH